MLDHNPRMHCDKISEKKKKKLLFETLNFLFENVKLDLFK